MHPVLRIVTIRIGIFTKLYSKVTVNLHSIKFLA